MEERIVPFAIVNRLFHKRATRCFHLVELYLAKGTKYIFLPITF